MATLRRVRSAIALVVGASLAGCSVMQPHIDMPPPVTVANEASPSERLAAEIERARELQKSYLNAVSAQTAAINNLAAIIIPLSASALAIGIIVPGVMFTRNYLVGAGAGAATLYGIGTITLDRKRDAVYYAGAKALYCQRIAGFPVEISDIDLRQMERDVEDLRLRLASAAAVGLDSSLINTGNAVFVSGRELLDNIRNAGSKFSADTDNINIVVNAEINKTEPDVSAILTTAGSLQKYASGLVGGFPSVKPPPAVSQGGRRPPTASVEANLRRSIELVSMWVAVSQNAVARANATLQAVGCVRTSGANASPVQPIIFVTDGQSVTTSQGIPGMSPTIITVQPTVQPPPPRLRGSSSAPISTGPNPEISADEMPKLRAAFGLTARNAPYPNWPNFREKVRAFQQCRGDPVTGVLTPQQKTAALSGTDACLARPSQPTTPKVPANPQPPPPRTR